MSVLYAVMTGITEKVQNVSKVSPVIKKQRGIEPRGMATVHVYIVTGHKS